MTVDDEGQGQDSEERREERARLTLPLLIPALAFLFALLVIYGLSRIYLELDTYEVGDVSMATPLAIGVSLIILLASIYLAGSRKVSGAQVGMLVTVSVALLTAGSVWAAVHDEGGEEVHVANGEPTPAATAEPGTIGVSLIDFEVILSEGSAPAGEITFNATNDGATLHNVRIVSTDLAPDALPVDEAAFAVDEDAVDVVASTDEIEVGASEELVADLAAGPYVIICNVPSHYESGMYAGFTVE